MPNTLDWKSCSDPRDVVHIIVQTLTEGKLVVLPSETTYVAFASGLRADAVSALQEYGETSGQQQAPSLFLRAAEEVFDYIPDCSPVAERMIRRGLPGPLVLELDASKQTSLVGSLPAEVRQKLFNDDRFLGLRVASHEAIREVLQLMRGPLVALPVLDSTGAPVSDAGEAIATDLSAQVVVVDGRTHFAGLATQVRVDGNVCRTVQPGVVDVEKLNRISQLAILIVCTGNTCRSPMAEAILQQIIAKRFPEVAAREPLPYLIGSAGLSAFPGGPASVEAVNAMKKRGVSLSNHQSRSVTEHALRHADLVLAMTNSHRHAIADRLPDLSDKVRLVSGGTQDVSDPFGGSASVYEACADQIEAFLESWADTIQENWFPDWQIN